MEEIMKKVEDIENRRAGKLKEQDVELIPTETEDNKDMQLQTSQENESASVHNDEDESDDSDSGFALWLRSISQCLSNKISDDPVVMPEEEEEEEESEEDLDEDTRCMRYVASWSHAL